MLPNLSNLDIGGKRKERDSLNSDEIDHLMPPAAQIVYKQLIERIIIEFKQPLEDVLIEDPCEVDLPHRPTAWKRRNVMRANALIDDSSFSRQMTTSSGRTLRSPIQEQTAKGIAALYFEALAEMDSNALRTKDSEASESARREILNRRLGAENAVSVWKALAEDAYTSLKAGGISVEAGKQVFLELSLERANQETYKGRTPYVHMDGYSYSYSDEDYKLGKVDGRSAFASSFCAQKIQYTDSATSNAISDIIILSCGTILYHGVPVITGTKIRQVVAKLKGAAIFKPCGDMEAIVTNMAEDLNQATVAALKSYSDARLAEIGITTSQVQALTWVDAHSRTFHRSPAYSDMFWDATNKPSDPWALSIWKWVKTTLTSAPRESTQMRFFSRLSVSEIGTFRDVEGFVHKRFELGDGTNAQVTIRTNLGL